MAPSTSSSNQAELQHTLCFVLQHSDLCHDIKALCSLLSVSTSCASSVHASCAGRASLTVATDFCLGAPLRDGLAPAAGKPGVLEWLAKHAVLLRQMQHRFPPVSGDVYDSQCLAAAMGAAAALPGGLKLQSLSTNSLPLLTAAASCSSLTQLQLQLEPGKLGLGPPCDASDGTSVQQALAAVTGLATQLRELQLSPGPRPQERGWPLIMRSQEEWFGAFMQQALPKLTVLTGLYVEGLHDSCVLTHAPAQLVELDCSHIVDKRDKALSLGHLTACTALMLGCWLRDYDLDWPGWRIIKAGDTLPPNLHRLCTVDCQSSTPLVCLPHLTELSMSRSYMHASELCQLSVLTSLQKVALGYIDIGGDGDTAESAAAGWSSVPGLQELLIFGQQIDPRQDTLECLGKLTGLKSLEWACSYIHKRPEDMQDFVVDNFGEVQVEQPGGVSTDAGLHMLGAALPRSLRELRLNHFVSGLSIGRNGDEPAVLVGCKALMQAVHALPHLALHTVESDSYGWSPAGKALFDRILAGEEVGSDDRESFATDFWAKR